MMTVFDRTSRVGRASLGVVAAAAACCAAPAGAQTLPAGFQVVGSAGPLNTPTCLAVAPDGRMFIGEQGGAVRIVLPDMTLVGPAFHTFTVDPNGERGLIGLALDPAFASNGFVYAYVTRPTSPAHNEIVRIVAAPPSSNNSGGGETVLVVLDNLSDATNHNGGALHFGPDGTLFAGVGENANGANAQSIANRLGKILRYNASGAIPADNPTSFPGIAGTTTGANRAIWAVGLRNPFTFNFDPGTGRMFINDVGEVSWEEINDGIAGRNYGWDTTEGDFNQASFPSFTRPVFTYPHSGGGPIVGQAISGGAFYRPAVNAFPAGYLGDYFFGDFIAGWVRRVDQSTGAVSDFAFGASGVVDLAVNGQGRLLILKRGAPASLLRVAYTACELRADSDSNGVYEPSDVAAFISAWLASLQNGTLTADFDDNGVVDPSDVAAFINAWFTALANGC